VKNKTGGGKRSAGRTKAGIVSRRKKSEMALGKSSRENRKAGISGLVNSVTRGAKGESEKQESAQWKSGQYESRRSCCEKGW